MYRTDDLTSVASVRKEVAKYEELARTFADMGARSQELEETLAWWRAELARVEELDTAARVGVSL